MYQLTEEGKKYLKDGLPEKNLLKSLPKNMSDISKMPNAAIAIGWARKNNWIEINQGVIELTEEGKSALAGKAEAEIALDEIDKKGDSQFYKILLSRKLIEERTAAPKTEIKEKKSFFSFIQKLFKKKETKEYEKKPIQKTTEIKEIAQLTPEMIKSGFYKSVPFKNYDIYAPAPKIYPGKKQHYIQFIEEIKD
ncbi:MAG: hypothetical protein PHU12_00545, partial [Candidatus Aenigmarchaeota archaeon]|nr:hypothetical protein [Candidatus Aenigmarchaeota archaeon]